MIIHPILGILTQWLLKKPLLKIWDPPWRIFMVPWLFKTAISHTPKAHMQLLNSLCFLCFFESSVSPSQTSAVFFDLPRAPAFQVTQIGLLANESGS